MHTIKRPSILIPVILAAFILVVPLGALVHAAAATVETVAVSISSPEGKPPARIAKRMEASVATVGNHVFTGRSIAEITAGKSDYERIVSDVIGRVLVGYSVEAVQITPGRSTQIAVTISPWGDVVRDVRLEVDFGSLSPEVADLITKDMGDLEDMLAGVLVGLPIDSLDWAGGVSKTVIRELLTAQLPEFRSNFDILSGTHTIVKLSLAPQGPVVQDTRVSLRSRTIPNVLLWKAKPAVEKAAKMMNGLPVAFVERHQDYFNNRLAEVVKDHPVAKEYGLTLLPEVIAGQQTQIQLKAETTKYRLTLEGYVDMGREEDNTAIKLHAGKFINSADELFTEVEFIPSSVSWKFYPGWSHKLGTTTYAGVKYDISDKDNILWLNQNFGSDWSLRLEHASSTEGDEIGLRYKIHDFLSAEYVVGEHENWLRLIGHL